jgi:hypothetical protein
LPFLLVSFFPLTFPFLPLPTVPSYLSCPGPSFISTRLFFFLFLSFLSLFVFSLISPYIPLSTSSFRFLSPFPFLHPSYKFLLSFPFCPFYVLFAFPFLCLFFLVSSCLSISTPSFNFLLPFPFYPFFPPLLSRLLPLLRYLKVIKTWLFLSYCIVLM